MHRVNQDLRITSGLPVIQEFLRSIHTSRLLVTDLLQLLNNHELYPIFARRSQPNAPGSRAGDTGDRGRVSQRLSDESLARVLKEHLCRTGRFRIQRDPTIPNRDSGVLR